MSRASMGSGSGGSARYPPTEFSQKYAQVLAPKGKLVNPKEVFGESGIFDAEVEEKTREAFRITIRKLEKLNTPSEKHKEDIERERFDQIVECFPHTMPEELPEVLPKIKWTKAAADVLTWDDWWSMHERILKLLKKQVKPIRAWWSFTGKPKPSEAEVLDSLKRLVSGVLTHPVTIGKVISEHTKRRKKNVAKSVHLVGTDRPEATMIYAGFFNEILASNPLNPIKLTLISPDEANRQLAGDCSPEQPMLIHPRCKLTAWEGLYHDFWDSYVLTRKVELPDLVMGLHPGLHADGLFEFWEPTLDVLLEQNIRVAFTVLSEEEYVQTLHKLDNLFVKYVYKGLNPFASKHVKQTPHDADLMWAYNQYLIVFRGRTVDLKNMTLIEDNDVKPTTTTTTSTPTTSNMSTTVANREETVNGSESVVEEREEEGNDTDDEFERILKENQ